MKRLLPLLFLLLATGCATIAREGAKAARRLGRESPRAQRHREPPPPLDVRPGHPRLVTIESDIERTRELIQSDPLAGHWFELVRARTNRTLNAPPPEGTPSDALKLSRQTLVRVTSLAGLYRITGEDRYARRAIREMLAVSDLPNWGRESFLAVAEMTAAVGFGYDWTYNVMSPDERKTISSAIVRNSLEPGLDAYDEPAGWTRAAHNWNLVCNGGLIVGALAVYEDQPDMAGRVLRDARESIRFGMSGFAPDGAWEEGPTYWNYATRYLTHAMAALESALGENWDLLDQPGVRNTGAFRIYTNGPTDQPFNFADCEPVIGNSAQMHWLASRIGRPEYAAFEQAHSEHDPGIFDLLWFHPINPKSLERLPPATLFRRVELVSLRTRWNDGNAAWIAMKGGSNAAHHGQLDLGTFVLDALGERWAIELGGDNYAMPGYFGDRRFSYYRCGTAGQNTLTFDGKNQPSDAAAKIARQSLASTEPFAVLELSEAYPAAQRARRGVALKRGNVLIQDEFEITRETDVCWQMHTGAAVDVAGRMARLRQGGKLLTARLLAPAGAIFEVARVDLVPPQEPAPGIRKLMVRIPQCRGAATIAIVFVPDGGADPDTTVRPLARWD